MTQKSKKTVGIGVLSWKAYQTLIKSLESYPQAFLDSFDERIIYFSDISAEDKEIAKTFGWDYAGGANEGIAGGMKRLAETMTTDYILLLQNDNPLCEDTAFAINHIQQAVEILDKGQADLARMRHRWKVGEGFADVTKYLKYYDVQHVSENYIADEHDNTSLKPRPFKKTARRLLKPIYGLGFHGRSVFIENDPAIIYPDVIARCNDFYKLDSSVIDFTDQCLLISRDAWLNIFMPYVEANPVSTRSSNGFQAPELSINKGSWWRDNHFKILQGQGVFTHTRHDGSFRKNHHSQEKNILTQ